MYLYELADTFENEKQFINTLKKMFKKAGKNADKRNKKIVKLCDF